MRATYQAIQASATAQLAAANLSVGEAVRRVVGLPTLAVIIISGPADRSLQCDLPSNLN